MICYRRCIFRRCIFFFFFFDVVAHVFILWSLSQYPPTLLHPSPPTVPHGDRKIPSIKRSMSVTVLCALKLYQNYFSFLKITNKDLYKYNKHLLELNLLSVKSLDKNWTTIACFIIKSKFHWLIVEGRNFNPKSVQKPT